MRKLLFFLVAATMLVSCNSDSNDDNEGKVNNGKKHEISFNVSGFSLDATPLKTLKANDVFTNYNFRYLVYNEAGKPVANVLLHEAKSVTMSDLKFSVLLEAGKYYVCAILYPFEQFDVVDPNKDYLEQTLSKTYPLSTTNNGVYYQRIECIISGNINENAIENMTLEPMWSTLNVVVTDANTFTPPAGATLYIYPTQQYLGVSLASKAPSESYKTDWFYDWHPNVTRTNYAAFKQNPQTSFIISAGYTEIEYRFRDLENNSSITAYRGELKNGKHYTLTGRLGKDKFYDISVVDFTEESLEFN